MKNNIKGLLLLATLCSLSQLHTSSTIPKNANPKIGYPGMAGAKGGSVYHKQTSLPAASNIFHTSSSPLFSTPLFVNGVEVGTFFVNLGLAYMIVNNVMKYFSNVTTLQVADPIFTKNFATIKMGNQTAALHGIELNDTIKAKIVSHYQTLMNAIPLIAHNASTLQNKTLAEVYEIALEALQSWLPKPTAGTYQ